MLGKTIESALPIMSRNRSGVIVQGAANKADLNFKYEKLQLILIDEIRSIIFTHAAQLKKDYA